MGIRSRRSLPVAGALLALALALAVQPSASATVIPPGQTQPVSVPPGYVHINTYVSDTDRVGESASMIVEFLNLGGRADGDHCLDAEMRTITRDGGVVQNMTCIGGDIAFGAQDWRFEPTDVTGLYRVRIGGERCLDADNTGGLRAGNKVQLWTCLGPGQLNQYWWLQELEPRQPPILVNDANGMCLSIKLLGNDPAHWLEDYAPAILLPCDQRVGQYLYLLKRDL